MKKQLDVRSATSDHRFDVAIGCVVNGENLVIGIFLAGLRAIRSARRQTRATLAKAASFGLAQSLTKSSAKLYRGRVADQIVEDLRGQILSGALPNGAQLPSERELATHYDVSAPTIREAVRVLAAMGLLNTRNGSRTTVTAQSEPLLAMSIASVIQFEKMTAPDVFGVLGALNAQDG